MMDESLPRVVTIGGGHGQAALLAALRHLRCEITAVVSVADDGGCSGKLRQELGMPPPGDLRRCLTTLARDRSLANRFELRLYEAGEEGRSAGNLALGAAFKEYGSLQKAVDWASQLLNCQGRVVPVAETPGVLVVYDILDGTVEGESTIEHINSPPLAAMVHGPTQTNPLAVEAIRQADIVLLGPGSFFTSTLATLTTANVAEALVETQGRCVLVSNLATEGKQTAGFSVLDYVRMLRDHLTIASMGGDMDLAVLQHVDGPDQICRLVDGTLAYGARLTTSGGSVHVPELLAKALANHFGFEMPGHDGPVSSIPPPLRRDREAAFDAYLARGRRMLRTPLAG